MKIFNAVHVLIFNFICVIFFTPISSFSAHNLIYDKIPHLDVSNPSGFVVFDILRETDDFYPLGLIGNPSADSREFIVDDLVTFGKDIKIVFGRKCISLTPFARNIKLTAKTVNLGVHVYIEYDLHGTKILKKYHETGFPLPGQPKSFRFVQVQTSLELEEDSDRGSDLSSEGSDLEDSKPQKKLFFTPSGIVVELSDYGDGDGDSSKPSDKALRGKEGEAAAPKEKAPVLVVPSKSASESSDLTVVDSQAAEDSFQEVSTTSSAVAPSTPSTPAVSAPVTVTVASSDQINVLDEELANKPGYKSVDIVKAPNNDFRCVWFSNTQENEVYKKLYFKSFQIPLSDKADAFEVCYTDYATDKYNFMVSSQFSSIVVEQIYKFGSGGAEPLLTFDPFAGLKSYPERRLPSPSKANPSPFELNVDDFTPGSDSAYDRIEAGKCIVYRYKDGLEDDERLGTVTSLRFGSNKFEIPAGKKFVMVSKCSPILSTYYVTIMLKDFFQYENIVFYSQNSKVYTEKKPLEDDERLELINMTSKVWHKRQSNGPMGNFDNGVDDEVEVLCLNQFTKKSGNSPKNCKKIDQLSNFKLLYHGGDFTNVVFTKRSPKSSVLIGNAIFDLETDNHSGIYLYLSHPDKEPTTLLVLNGENETFSITEKGTETNIFMPVTNSFHSINYKATKKDLNFGHYRSRVYGITWDYNDSLKKYYLFPSNFPEYCLGDLTLRNMKILSYKEEGYKQITSNALTKLENVTVTIMLPTKKIVLEVVVENNKYTKVNMKSTVTGSARHEEL